jgi:hypothetical protein
MTRRLTTADLAMLERVLILAKGLHEALAALERSAYAVTQEADRRGHTFEALYGDGNFDALVLLERLGLELEDEDGAR